MFWPVTGNSLPLLPDIGGRLTEHLQVNQYKTQDGILHNWKKDIHSKTSFIRALHPAQNRMQQQHWKLILGLQLFLFFFCIKHAAHCCTHNHNTVRHARSCSDLWNLSFLPFKTAFVPNQNDLLLTYCYIVITFYICYLDSDKIIQLSQEFHTNLWT